jgi:putative membrane protein
MGLFLLIVNALVFTMVAWILPGFSISSFGAAVIGWLIVAVTSWVVTVVVK